MNYKVFIAYTGKSSRLANAIVNGLDPELAARRWPNAFQLGEGTFDGLIQKAKQYDFGIFALTPNDFQKVGDRSFLPPNVVFELGLFVGTKGKGRAFLIVPQGHDNDLPADLRGITYAEYDPNNSDLDSAVERACAQVQREIYEVACTNCHFLLNKKSGKCLDVEGLDKSDGVAIIQWPYHGSPNQLWSLDKLDEGWFRLTSQNSGKCLQVRDASFEENALVEQGSYTEKPHQQWSFTSFSGGAYQVRVRHSGKCLTVVEGEGERGGARIVQRTWSEDNFFLWWIAEAVTLT